MKFILFFIMCLAYLPLFFLTDNNELILVEDEFNKDESISEDTNENEPATIFEATNEWQEVENRVLPRGLHVRINLETGKKEAKLLESSSKLDIHSRITTNYQMLENDVSKPSAESLKRLNDFKDISKSNSIKYKNIKEIKENGVEITSENTLLQEAMNRYLNEKEEKSKLAQLTDIEYYVHSIDLANNLFQSGGLSKLIQDFNRTNSADVKLAILSVIGAAVQGNIQLKSELYKMDFLRHIVVLLDTAKEIPLLRKCLLVLGAMVRNFPLAQKALFHSFNGFDILEPLLTSKDRHLATRTASLIGDIAIELASVTNEQVYNEAQFGMAIKNSNICQKFVEIIADRESLVDQSLLEIMLESMNGLFKVCNFYSNKSISDILTILSQSYSSNDFISDTLAKLRVNLNVKDEL